MTDAPRTQSDLSTISRKGWVSARAKLIKLVGAGALISGILLGGSNVASAGQVIYSPLVNPSANIAPNPNFLTSGTCTGSAGNWSCQNPCISANLSWTEGEATLACDNYVLQAINNARSQLGENPLTLPSNWMGLTTEQQLFVFADMERTSAGYPAYLGINSALSAQAEAAAAKNADPQLASGFAVGNNPWGNTGYDGAWAGTGNVLFADYMWMYDDGWGGASNTSNIVCTSPTAWACWAHRDELLGSSTSATQGVGLGCSTCEMGTGFATVNGSGSLVDLIELPKGAPPAMSFTWASELAYFSAGDNPPVTAPTGGGTTPSTSPTVGKVNYSLARFGTAGLGLNWSVSAGSTYIVGAEVYASSSCKYGARVYKTATNSAMNGTLNVPVKGWFVAHHYYSVRMIVGEAGGVATGGCRNLGYFL